MPVFLSHKREDTDQAVAVMQFLESRRVKCYIDVLDPTLETTDDLTKMLRNRVRQCTHLMAVVSDYTTKSWWVPFEIGVGSELERRIATYRLENVALPDYLTKWPILASRADLEKFVSAYRMDTAVAFSEGRSIDASVQDAATFHAELKRRLNQ